MSTKERREKVVEKVKAAINDGYSPVVVVSAMGRKGEPYATDTLLSLLSEQYKNSNKLGTDMLMCCGEFISSVVMSNDLYSNGIPAVPLTGGQAGIRTDNNFTDAKALSVDTKLLLNVIAQGNVPVVTGFQGMTEEGYFTTLGRGGSDTSGALLGVALNAERVEIYTDVDGIMTADPRIVENASLIDVISYNEIFQLADQGAKVIHPKAVEIAMKGNIPLLIKNTMSDCKGTLINNIGDSSNPRLITGITHQSNRIQVNIKKEDNLENPKYNDILNLLAINKISLDLINIFPKEKIFTIDVDRKEVIEKVFKENNIKYSLIENCVTLALVGSRMTGIPGVMAKIVKALDDNGIEVLQTADSHMTIWCLIHEENVKEATKVLHEAFELG